ncbi:BTB/POZ domain-containing protein At5g47800 isoform X1 [Gossypium arboreum]|uniref:BTB/POZ domain-containing protein At5g47800 isoform X1 n=1 Tax=Gossypium arboreum TaxID=29729 RepID=UPI000818F7B3|nr:BTB/POZ domain-containing protein At5g47800 isoform X1 [Gossypium arboreum]XP_017639565.1 BTB/POZ domain-containing protein At5g47800 isoform X1 [Gossypium arboreum]XP_017639566.1 BTB/POZ domain-containing protein At5g47800 isoform X1 [Gossypium arboreum]XP_017639568.1 BTB/POZ domain-containing protein At5g47800 isoform X1 [Gossypium arboreum]XP_052885566.1 BTB/POZ domain-containing protein At5g47800 isoform X1 [Gossypium arboreum]XP_052885567.1 BTB/POZ domain-containing protein At5g47800 i
MKFMKIGTKPDTFYTEEATRTVISDIPSDLTIRIDNVCFLLHKLQIPLVPKCGLLQRLCSDADDSDIVTIDLHDVPGGEDAFELCAKFCYGITINLGAHNFVPAFCAAKFLRMTESIEKGNFVLKLEAFFNSCILEGWKDSIVALQTTIKLPEWSENLGIIRRCIDSIVEKILTPTSKVSWSYTYTRPGYIKKQHQSVPKDWWTEDVSDLDIDLFRCIITAVRSTYIPPPQLIGEALHVYACRWLPDTTKSRPLHSSGSQTEESREKSRRILEAIVSMIPSDRGSVSIGFLLKLLSIANYLGASPVTKTELIRKAGLQFEEATLNDMLFPSQLPTDQHFYDIDLVAAVLESYLVLWRRQSPLPTENSHMVRSIRKIGKFIDSYLQVVARDVNMPISKLVSLAEALPDVAREDHDGLYKAINIYLKEHPDVSKADKKRMCRMLDCQKLSPEVRAHAVKNERLPLRTVVQVLFFDQESGSRSTTHKPESITRARQAPIEAEAKEECDKKVQHEGTKSSSRVTETSEREIQKRMEAKMVRGDSEKGKERKGETNSTAKMMEPKQVFQRRSSR